MTEAYQDLLARRAAVADEITSVIDKLGTLVTEEETIQNQLHRLGAAAGVRANVFSTANSFMDGVCSELTRAGLSIRRSDPRFRLSALVVDQHRRYRALRQTRPQVTDQSAA